MFGYGGRILRVDVTSGQTYQEAYGDDLARRFLGGNGFAAKLIHDGVPPQADPFGPENAIVFTVGPLTDTPVWGTSRGHMAAISPLTGYFADSNYGGQFGTAQKRTGFDAIYITGKSARPVYLVVTEDGGELKGADDLWGKTTEETNSLLQAREGKDAVAAAIGPAGENGVLFASVVCGGSRPGTAGRGGLGAVMGAKNLKAIVALGSRKTEVAHPTELAAFLKEKRSTMKQNTALLTTCGTSFLVDFINGNGMMGTHNAAKEIFEYADDINAETLNENYIEGRAACPGCPVACGKKGRAPSGEYAGRSVKMPEYETLYALGSMLDNRDIVSIINGNALCDLLGLDTISMGVTLSFVAECLEKGVVTEGELGGTIRFGDGDGMVALVKATAHRQGIGNLLAQGSERLAKRFGGDAAQYLYSVKGMEIAGHSARGIRNMGLGYATSTRGGSHQDSRPRYSPTNEDPGFDGQAAHNIATEHFTAVGDSLIMCRFIAEKGLGILINENLTRIVNLVAGLDLEPQDLEIIGERIYNLERLINVRRGASRKHDTLPHRTMTEPIPEGPAKGRYCPPEQLYALLDEYYRLRGWTADGIPANEKLSELGLA